MDVLICMGLTALELLTVESLSSHVLDRYVAAIIFILQYMTLKVYRIYLYPKHLSPLRHIPGPTVREIFVYDQLLLTDEPSRTTTSFLGNS